MPSLPWSLWRERFAKRRKLDAPVIEHYIADLLESPWASKSEPFLSFLEVSPLRFLCPYGPSLKEGYVHLKANGAQNFPFYGCSSRFFEAFYRQAYRVCLKFNFLACVLCVMLPLVFVILVYVPYALFSNPEENMIELPDGTQVQEKLAEASPLGSLWITLLILLLSVFMISHIFKFFQRRLGRVRRWAVLKPSCIAAFKKRSDREPSEVFLFDESFSVEKSGFKQGVTWMPNGLIVNSMSGPLELDVGIYYTRLTSFVALVVAILVVSFIGQEVWFDYQPVVTSAVKDVAPFNSTGINSAYCGLYFEAPVDLYVRSTDVNDILIAELSRDPFSAALSIDSLYSFIDDVFDTRFFLTPSSVLRFINKGSLIGISRPSVLVDTTSASGTMVPVNGLDEDTLTIYGMIGQDGSARDYVDSDMYCAIDFEVAEFKAYRLFLAALTLVFGGIVASVLSITITYIFSYLGVWHAHIRRDQWLDALRALGARNHRTEKHRFGSFAPERPPAVLKEDSEKTDFQSEGFRGGAMEWYVDGEPAFAAIRSAIEGAKHQIFIAGWWISPDVYLTRPGSEESMLKNLLLKKANEGVTINVLLYREISVVLDLGSYYTKEELEKHPNVRVLRDPRIRIQDIRFWSHHEKIVVVDQWLSFIGGLDLCFGRFDTSAHALCEPSEDEFLWPGKDYSNPIIKDFVRLDRPDEDLIDRSSVPRMPWHDIHCSVSGHPAQDIAMHFIQRWNFVCSKRDYFLRTGWCICFRTRKFQDLPKCIMPMDALGLAVEGNSKKRRFDANPSSVLMSSAASSAADCEENGRSFSRRLLQPAVSLSEIGCVWPTAIESNLLLKGIRPASHRPCKLQILRSVGQWSAGVRTEHSIQEAYIHLISSAKHYLYIENQYFVSGMDGNHIIRNRILQALVDRISRAILEKSTFRVYVFIPLLPAFEGEISVNQIGPMHAVMHWQFETINRGPSSLFKELRKLTEFPENYVQFCALRNYGVMPDSRLVTEQVYIHSKLMIVDDCRAIVGSANINDRSLNGDRDSEIGMLIEDIEFQSNGVLEDKPFEYTGALCRELRKNLFREHLGLTDHLISISSAASTLENDPCCSSSWEYVRSVAKRNTALYEHVFQCAPSNRLVSFASFENIEIFQVYENQRLNPLKGPLHAWDSANLREKGDCAAWTDINGVQVPVGNLNLVQDYVLDTNPKECVLSVDSDGWMYARNFSVFQEVRTIDIHRRREKLQHLFTDRFLAKVRRRRWVRRDHANFTPRHSSKHGGTFSVPSPTSNLMGTNPYTNISTPIAAGNDARNDLEGGKATRGTSSLSSIPVINVKLPPRFRISRSVSSPGRPLETTNDTVIPAEGVCAYSPRSVRSSTGACSNRGGDDDLPQLGQISTLASVPSSKGGIKNLAEESKEPCDDVVGGQIQDVQGHIVEFPLEFLSEEVLRPPLLPPDLYI